MALLQISEPGNSPEPHQERLVAGIDLGTTHSLIALVESGITRILADQEERVLLPSVVHYGTSKITVGHDARAQIVSDPLNTISSVKRLMGKGYDELDAYKHLPYQWLAPQKKEQPLTFNTAMGARTAPQVSADILAALKAQAESRLAKPINDAVITIPAYFDERQREATKVAARLAGLNVLRLLSEPTAAALAYGLDDQVDGYFAVYDLGGGTFDVSILNLTEGVFEVVASGGDTQLGGDDYDDAIYRYLCEKIGATTLSIEQQRYLLGLAKECKEKLSEHQFYDVTIALENGSQNHSVRVSQELFNQLTRALTERTITVIKQTVRDAGVSFAEIKAVVLVGGSSYMPQIKAAVAKCFGLTPLCSLDPEQVVALGAARQAHKLVQKQQNDDWLLLDVTPLSLGLETMGGLTEKVIPRNTPLPCSMAQEFTTFKDGQTAMAIHVVQGERETVKDCRSLGRFELRGIPPMAAGSARIRVHFDVDADGLLTVRAQELNSGVESEVVIRPSVGLSEEDIADMLNASFENAAEDVKQRLFIEAKVAAEQLLSICSEALKSDASLLTEQELQKLNSAMAELAQIVAENSAVAEIKRLKEATQKCQQASDVLAQKRMNASIQKSLKGKNIDSC